MPFPATTSTTVPRNKKRDKEDRPFCPTLPTSLDGTREAGQKGLSPLSRLAVIAFWLVAWQLASMAVGSRIVLVGPAEVARRLTELVREPAFWTSVALSLSRIAVGFAAALVAGVAAAAAAACARWVEALLAPLVGAVKAAPVASFVVLVLMWVPSSRLSVVISFLMAFPIIYTNVLEGVRQTDASLLEMAQVFGIRGRALVGSVYAAQVLPYLRAGMSLACGLSWKSGIAAEVIGLPAPSIGIHLYDAKVYLDTPDLFAWTLVIVLLSVGIEALLERLLDWAQATWEARL